MFLQQTLNKTWFILCLVFISSFISPLRGLNTDSLKTALKKNPDKQEVCKILNEKAYELSFTNPSQAFELLNEAEKISKEINYETGNETTKKNMAHVAILTGDYKKSEAIYKDLIIIHQKKHNIPELAKIYNNLGRVYNKIGNYEKGAENLLLALSSFESIKDFNSASATLLNLGILNLRMNHPEKALSYLIRTLKNTSNNPELSGNIYEHIGISYKMLHKTDLAQDYLKLSEKEFMKDSGGQRELNIADVYENMASVFIDAEDDNQAAVYSQKALSIYKTIKEPEGIITCFISLAAIHFNMAEAEHLVPGKKAEFEKSLRLIDSAEIMAKKFGFNSLEAEIYKRKAEVFWKLNIQDSAYIYYRRFGTLQDSLTSVEKEARINELNIEYETEKKEKEIALLEKNNADVIILSEQRKVISIITISISLLFILLIIFILYRNKSKKKQLETEYAKNKIELEHKALRAQMNPHFLFNSLNSIQRMFIEGKTDSANDAMADFGNLLRRILNNSGKDKISLKEEIDTLKLYLDIEKMRCDNCFDFEFDVEETLDLLNTKVPPLIIQPFVENAIWHGILPKKQKGNIKISISQNAEQNLICMIEDNGVGFGNKKPGAHPSKGIEITEQRLGKKIIINQPPGGGTSILITIPLNS